MPLEGATFFVQMSIRTVAMQSVRVVVGFLVSKLFTICLLTVSAVCILLEATRQQEFCLLLMPKYVFNEH